MYQRYCSLQGWKTEILSLSESDMGGFKEAMLEVEGRGAYAKLKFESGVHRVQRVPVTESQGRIHTSAATVAVLPEAEDVDVDILDKDLRIDLPIAPRAAGGQHVQARPTARCASPIFPPIRWWRCRRKNPSTRTRPRR